MSLVVIIQINLQPSLFEKWAKITRTKAACVGVCQEEKPGFGDIPSKLFLRAKDMKSQNGLN